MNITSGYELTTSITNIAIFIVSIIGVFIIKKQKLWRLFYILLSIDSFIGVIVHGIIMSKDLNDILWIILSILFTLTINTLFCIFVKLKLKYGIILSFLLSILLITQLILDLDFILTFILYVLLIMIVTFTCIIIDKYKNKKWFITAYIIQLIGGILLLCKIKLHYLNYNGICHLFTAITLLIFIIAIKKNE